MTGLPAGYAEKIYAGVLGKIIGVYLGRPVEGWPYDRLRARFGELSYYVSDQLGEPLVVADDDVSGTFAFGRAIADHGYPATLAPQQAGDTWLNYIIENRTILWWGGLGRSTEHTAYLRLRDGVQPPRSGSYELNGPTLPEQVGAQIFSDAIAMAYPGDPDQAAAAVRAAASVSHDGVALDAAAFLAAIRALAFDVTDLGRLLDACRHHVRDHRLAAAIDDVTAVCDGQTDWRAVREHIDQKIGYHAFDGPCHVIPNHAMTLAALLLGGDDFQRSVMIAASAGFDTDSNAGVVGCVNGIRLGLDAITAQVDFRAPVADRMLVVTADGGSCVTDAVRETRAIVRAAERLRAPEPLPGTERLRGATSHPHEPRFTFQYRGSVQGFQPCPYARPPYPAASVSNANASTVGGPAALVIGCTGVGPGIEAAVSTPVFPDPAECADNFSTIASPTLYPGQLIRLTAHTTATAGSPALRLYVLARDGAGEINRTASPPFPLTGQPTQLTWRVPPTAASPLIRFGLAVQSAQRFDGDVHITAIDWRGAPGHFTVDGILLTDIWDIHPEALTAWVSSAANFEADSARTFSISHPRGPGLATIGCTDWDDYAVSATLYLSLHRAAGLVARSTGHRRYYAAIFDGGNRVRLIRQRDATHHVLAETAFAYRQDAPYTCELACHGNRITLDVNGERIATATDPSYRSGAAGFLVDTGTMLADAFAVRAITGEASA
ncbi:MAG TPA: ADP-ribosylglycohydrolase family protein [Streptosporangiaceae bacterium]